MRRTPNYLHSRNLVAEFSKEPLAKFIEVELQRWLDTQTAENDRPRHNLILSGRLILQVVAAIAPMLVLRYE